MNRKPRYSIMPRDIADEAVRQGVDPLLAVAIAETESGGNADALSPKGARGIMQLMPGTARGQAAKMGERYNPNDDMQNVRLGVGVIKELQGKYGNNYDLIGAGYNAGEGAVDKYGGMPPYKETRAYVPKVRAAYERRASIFNEDSAVDQTAQEARPQPPAPPAILNLDKAQADMAARELSSLVGMRMSHDVPDGFRSQFEGEPKIQDFLSEPPAKLTQRRGTVQRRQARGVPGVESDEPVLITDDEVAQRDVSAQNRIGTDWMHRGRRVQLKVPQARGRQIYGGDDATANRTTFESFIQSHQGKDREAAEFLSKRVPDGFFTARPSANLTRDGNYQVDIQVPEWWDRAMDAYRRGGPQAAEAQINQDAQSLNDDEAARRVAQAGIVNEATRLTAAQSEGLQQGHEYGSGVLGAIKAAGSGAIGGVQDAIAGLGSIPTQIGAAVRGEYYDPSKDYEWVKTFREAAVREQAAASGDAVPGANILRRYAGAAGSMVPYILGGAASGGSKLVAGGLGALGGASSQLSEAIQSGATPGQAQRAFAGGGVVGSTNAFGFRGKVPEGQGWVGALKEMGWEGVEEAVQGGLIEQGGQNLTASTFAGYDPKRKVTDGMLEAVVLSAVLGSGASGVTHGIGHTLEAITPGTQPEHLLSGLDANGQQQSLDLAAAYYADPAMRKAMDGRVRSRLGTTSTEITQQIRLLEARGQQLQTVIAAGQQAQANDADLLSWGIVPTGVQVAAAGEAAALQMQELQQAAAQMGAQLAEVRGYEASLYTALALGTMRETGVGPFRRLAERGVLGTSFRSPDAGATVPGVASGVAGVTGADLESFSRHLYGGEGVSANDDGVFLSAADAQALIDAGVGSEAARQSLTRALIDARRGKVDGVTVVNAQSARPMEDVVRAVTHENVHAGQQEAAGREQSFDWAGFVRSAGELAARKIETALAGRGYDTQSEFVRDRETLTNLLDPTFAEEAGLSPEEHERALSAVARGIADATGEKYGKVLKALPVRVRQFLANYQPTSANQQVGDLPIEPGLDKADPASVVAEAQPSVTDNQQPATERSQPGESEGQPEIESPAEVVGRVQLATFRQQKGDALNERQLVTASRFVKAFRSGNRELIEGELRQLQRDGIGSDFLEELGREIGGTIRDEGDALRLRTPDGQEYPRFVMPWDVPDQIERPKGRRNLKLKPEGGQRLSDFVRSMGGLQLREDQHSNRGELSYLFQKESGKRGLVSRRRGLPTDLMRSYANSEGYGPFETEDDFLQAVRADVEGKETFSYDYDLDARGDREDVAGLYGEEFAGWGEETQAQGRQLSDLMESDAKFADAIQRIGVINSTEKDYEHFITIAAEKGVDGATVDGIIAEARRFQFLARQQEAYHVSTESARRATEIQSEEKPQAQAPAATAQAVEDDPAERAAIQNENEAVSAVEAYLRSHQPAISAEASQVIPELIDWDEDADWSSALVGLDLGERQSLLRSLAPMELEEAILAMEKRRNDSIRGKLDLSPGELRALAADLWLANSERKVRVRNKELPAKYPQPAKMTEQQLEWRKSRKGMNLADVSDADLQAMLDLGEALVQTQGEGKPDDLTAERMRFVKRLQAEAERRGFDIPADETRPRVETSEGADAIDVGSEKVVPRSQYETLVQDQAERIARLERVHLASDEGRRLWSEIVDWANERGIERRHLRALRATLQNEEMQRAVEQDAIDREARRAATSPTNDLPQPTEGQKQAGNYQKGHLRWQGLDVTIEYPKGSTRSGVDAGGKPWDVEMSAHYGYVKGSEGADGEQVDVYIADNPTSDRVFVFDQKDFKTGAFDEHKVVLGANDEAQATALYDAHFSDGKGAQRRAGVTAMSLGEFKQWLKGDTSQPLVKKSLSDDAQMVLRLVQKQNGLKRGEVNFATMMTNSRSKPAIQELLDAGRIVEQDGVLRVPAVGDEATQSSPKAQNFTQFAAEKGYPSDFDVMDHGDISPNGRVSKRARKAGQDRQSQRAELNRRAHEEFEAAIERGEVIDAEGKITRELIIENRTNQGIAEAKRKLEAADNYIRHVESLGKMSHSANGKLKAAYQRGVDVQLRQKEEVYKHFPELRESEGQSPLFSRRRLTQTEDAPFYSQLERVAKDKIPVKADVSQVRAILTNPQNGVKQEEYDWLGMNEWLRSLPDGKVTRQQVLDFIRENQVEVREVTKGAGAFGFNDAAISREVQALKEAGWEPQQLPDDASTWAFYDTTSGELASADEMQAWHDESGDPTAEVLQAARAVEAHINKGDASESPAKFSNYVLPGAQDGSYRELLITMPNQQTFKSLDRAARRIYPGKSFADLRPEQQAQVRTDIENDPRGALGVEATYQSSHFDEPNILAHVRFNERTDAEGRRVLFVEEIQSDWHQEGRKKGYKSDSKREDAKWRIADGVGTERDWQIVEQTAGQVPDAPFKKSWHEVAFKRALRHAVENGYDSVAWTTGEQQVARYGLSKQIDRIEYKKLPSGRYNLVAYDLSKNRVLSETAIDIARVEDVIGKEIAQKIQDTPGPTEAEAREYGELLAGSQAGWEDLPESRKWSAMMEEFAAKYGEPDWSYSLTGQERADYDSAKRAWVATVAKAEKRLDELQHLQEKTHTLSGVDLEVGGEGMKGFYDKILPAFVNKYVKKWGAKVGTAAVETHPEEGRSFDPDRLRVELDGRWWRVAEYSHAGNFNGYHNRSGATREEAEAARERILNSYKRPAQLATVHSVPVTPAMRESVMQGQPLFARRRWWPESLQGNQQALPAEKGAQTSNTAKVEPVGDVPKKQAYLPGQSPSELQPLPVEEGVADRSYVASVGRFLEQADIPREKRVAVHRLLVQAVNANGNAKQVEKIKEQIERELGILQRPEGAKAKAAVAAKVGYELVRTLSFFGDQPHLRQALFLSVPPRYWAKAAGDTKRSLKAIGSEKTYKAMRADLLARPGAVVGEQYGLYLGLTRGEEGYTVHFQDRIPVVRNFERAYKLYLDARRIDAFERFTGALAKDLSAEEFEAQARQVTDLINVVSGRAIGKIGETLSGDKIKTAAALAFTAPNFQVSRFQTLGKLGQAAAGNWGGMPKSLRRQFLKDAASAGAVLVAFKLLASAVMGGDKDDLITTTDTDDRDFLKFCVGNTVIDMSGGLVQPLKLAGQAVAFFQNRWRAMDDQQKKKATDEFTSEINSFVSSRLHPMIQLAWRSLFSGQDFDGQPINYTLNPFADNSVTAGFAPLLLRDLKELYQEDGARGVALGGALAFFGAGTKAYPRTRLLSTSPLKSDLRKFDVSRGGLRRRPGEPVADYKKAWNETERRFAAQDKVLADSPAYKNATDEAKRRILDSFVRSVTTGVRDEKPAKSPAYAVSKAEAVNTREAQFEAFKQSASYQAMSPFQRKIAEAAWRRKHQARAAVQQ